jgi:hypothetical protein
MSARSGDRFNWPLVIGFWLLLAALLIMRSLTLSPTVPLYGDSDDAMRMVTAGELLAGQSWQDHVVTRDNTPYGASLHWSRLVDAPIAALELVAEPVLADGARDFAARVWPTLLILPLLILCVALARRLAPGTGQIAALGLAAVTLVFLAEFAPGRVDHHNVQIILTGWLLLAMLDSRDRPLHSILAGVLAATSLAIGMETLPIVVAAIVVQGAYWAFEPIRFARQTRWFGLAFALATLGHFLLATPPAQYFQTACDMISPVYVVAAALVALALGAASYVGARFRTVGGRLALVGGWGALAGLGTLLLFPACAAGPYASVDAGIYQGLFPAILEAQPLWVRAMDAPALAIGIAAVPLLALCLLVYASLTSRGEERTRWLTLLAFLLLAVVVMLLQNRGARLAAIFAIPVGAWVIGRAFLAFRQRQGLASAFAVIGACLLFASVVQFRTASALATLAPAPAMATATPSSVDCFAPATYTALAALPPRRIMAPIRIGPHILNYTPHSVVSAGFHRNNDGTRDVLAFFNGGEALARTIADARRLDYLVTCDGLAEVEGTPQATADSFVALRHHGKTWPWLVQVSPAGAPLTVYAIQKAQ